MDKLKLLKAERTQLRRTFTKISNEIGKLLDEADIINQMLVKVNFSKFQDKAERLFKLDEDIKIVLYSDELIKEEELDAEFESTESYRDICSSIRAKYDNYVSTLGNQSESEFGGSSNNRASPMQVPRNYLNLPKLQLIQFDGDVKNWIGFWGQFKKVHEDINLEPEDKFQYLIQSLKPGSTARELVDSFPPSGKNYDKALEQLKSRFGRDEFLIEVYVRELLSLVLQQVTVGSNTRLCRLYDKLETQLRALETLGVTSDKYASMLYPLVESALPEETLKAWERYRSSRLTNRAESEPQTSNNTNYLQELLDFLKAEVESEERLALARSSFKATTCGDNETKGSSFKRNKKDFRNSLETIPTAASLLSTGAERPKGSVSSSCTFCSKGGHNTQDCYAFQKLSLDQRNDHVTNKGCCFACLKPGHTVKRCKTFVKCLYCGKKHYAVMCKVLNESKSKISTQVHEGNTNPQTMSEVLSTTESRLKETLLQTLIVKVTDVNGKDYLGRVLLDSGSQRSYITKDCVTKLGLREIGSEVISHTLFGGVNVKKTAHKNYLVNLKSVNSSFEMTVPLTDHEKICNYVPRFKSSEFLSILNEKNIVLTDVGHDIPEVKILLGADVLADLYTGAIQKIDDRLVAIETFLGWTVMGKQPCKGNHNTALLSMFCNTKSEIKDLWSLETIGIRDPIEVKQSDSVNAEVFQHFKENVRVNDESRYEVCLPWLEGRPDLYDNRDIAERRLMSTSRRLHTLNKFNDYSNVFQEWLREGIVERVLEKDDMSSLHYLPHHAVIKDSSLTTKIRPVFDASAKDKRGHSLNECLASGPNLVEQIPTLIMKFRKKQIGVTADIKKAFLQISVSPHDRDYLRFLWWESYSERKIMTLRHCRVVFGLSSSPFLLGATIKHHLENLPCKFQETAEKLKEAFYVDNCILSVDSAEELGDFVKEASELMNLGQFELRQWASNHSEDSDVFNDFSSETYVPLLGMLWDRVEDKLFCDVKSISMPDKDITKRELLSVSHRIFDVVGFTCPVTLLPKLLLQEVWSKRLSWDDVLPNEIVKKFSNWIENIHWLEFCRIPRRINPLGNLCSDESSVHVFCDASILAYAACVFVRTEAKSEVAVQLVYAKSRIAVKNATIPRLELMAALLGARIFTYVQEALKLTCRTYFWTDSSIVLTWIKEKQDWGTFVGNRCKEICKTTSKDDWRHISGDLNPADLPSRGCSAKTLYESQWWEGPQWLRSNASQWPTSNLKFPDPSAYVERKKSVISAVATENSACFTTSLVYFSSYSKLLRMVAWMLRFCRNARLKCESIKGHLTGDEIIIAEEKVILCIQQETFREKSKFQKNLPVFTDETSILRVKTRLTLTSDGDDYKFPILLPSSHPIVTSLIMEHHLTHNHAGLQSMIVIIRERYWVQRARKTIRNVINQCVVCKRFKAKAGEAPIAPLPLDRISDCNAFQSTGIDLAGPLFLKNGQRAWVVLFTCTVYRAVHLELVQSLSTESFISALRRFVARRGRVLNIYTDNGTNFVGTNNLLKKLDWKFIQDRFEIQQISWKFNPPSAPWWGGMWERLVRTVKELLRRNLKLARVDYEELITLLCDFESTINSRPLTYVSDEYDSLEPLTPALFLQPIVRCDVPDLDIIDSSTLNKRVKYLQRLRQGLRSRFKKEYIAMLVHRAKGNEGKEKAIMTGDVVLIGDDNLKRINWPLALVVDMLPGKDGVCRVAKLKTAKGELTRPVQRLYSLEVRSNEVTHVKQLKKEVNKEDKVKPKLTVRTRGGRKVKIPDRMDL